eukprot:scaffold25608_cov33-Phaeocystis_antarctica.AAC.1
MAEAERSAYDDGAATAARRRLRRRAARSTAGGRGEVQRRLLRLSGRAGAWREAGRCSVVPGAKRGR